MANDIPSYWKLDDFLINFSSSQYLLSVSSQGKHPMWYITAEQELKLSQSWIEFQATRSIH
jgi:hypothetical protein